MYVTHKPPGLAQALRRVRLFNPHVDEVGEHPDTGSVQLLAEASTLFERLDQMGFVVVDRLDKDGHAALLRVIGKVLQFGEEQLGFDLSRAAPGCEVRQNCGTENRNQQNPEATDRVAEFQTAT